MCICQNKQKPKNNNEKLKVLKKSNAVNKHIKLVLCGNSAVGKTSITMRYKEEKIKMIHEPTLAGAYQEKTVKSKTGEQIQLRIWDTVGDERYRSIMPLYYRDAQIALLVFDITDPQSFSAIDYWFGQLQQKVKVDGMIIWLVGNKKDLEEQRRVSKQQALLKASEKNNCFYIQTSALTGEGIQQLFGQIVEECSKSIAKK